MKIPKKRKQIALNASPVNCNDNCYIIVDPLSGFGDCPRRCGGILSC